MPKNLVNLLLALLLVGCAEPVRRVAFEKPDQTQAGFALDKYECVQQSRTNWSGGGSGAIGLAIMAGAERKAQRQADQLFTLCMESRGYKGRVLQEGEAFPVRP